MSKPKPVLDDDGYPMCSIGCPYYTTECKLGRRVEYCSHKHASDSPEDPSCRPYNLALRARVAELEAERDEARAEGARLRAKVAKLESERDQYAKKWFESSMKFGVARVSMSQRLERLRGVIRQQADACNRLRVYDADDNPDEAPEKVWCSPIVGKDGPHWLGGDWEPVDGKPHGLNARRYILESAHEAAIKAAIHEALVALRAALEGES